MDWNRVTRAWRRVIGYLKSKVENDDGERGGSPLAGDGWRGNGRPGFPQVPEPAFAKIPK